MDFSKSYLGNNNLGGVGPGPNNEKETLEIRNVGTYRDDKIDLVITILPSANSMYLNHLKEGDQTIWDSSPQNRVFGSFLQINMKADYQADMQFCIVDHESKAPVTLDEFSLTLHDFGASRIHTPPRPAHTPTPTPPQPRLAQPALLRPSPTRVDRGASSAHLSSHVLVHRQCGATPR